MSAQPQQQQQYAGFRPETFVAPPEQDFLLPDNTPVHVAADEHTVAISLAGAAAPTVVFAKQERTLRTSPHGIVNDDRAEHAPVLLVTAPARATVPRDDLWAAIYALCIRRYEDDVIPAALDDASLANADELLAYLTQTGLAFSPPDAAGARDVLLVRAAFWQGAGAPVARHWLRDPIPHPSLTMTSFPRVTSFTRGENVCTTHPLRPPKPAPGRVIYSRWIFSLGEQLTFTHIDGSNPEHFEVYKKWQNSDRVNVGWRERGPDEKHRKYLADRLADPHIMGFLVSWNGEHAGYGEMSWVKEDHMNSFVGGLGDYDQGTHLLIGEEKFRGRQRFTAIMTAMKHMCFLRDPRTDVVVGEPRYDLPIIPRLIAYLPQEFNREFEMPHKRAVYFVLRRERFFQAAILY